MNVFPDAVLIEINRFGSQFQRRSCVQGAAVGLTWCVLCSLQCPAHLVVKLGSVEHDVGQLCHLP